LSLAVVHIHRSPAAGLVGDPSPVPDIPDRVIRDAMHTDLDRIFATREQSDPGAPGRSQGLGQSFLEILSPHPETTAKSEEGGGLDGRQMFGELSLSSDQ
jgi:hypothetical protein